MISSLIILSFLSTLDPHSFSNFDQVQIEKFDLRLAVDIVERKMVGSVEHFLKKERSSHYLVLDTKSLKIKNIRLRDSQGILKSTPWNLESGNPILGAPLHIVIESDTQSVLIDYETGKDAEAMGWIEASQTASKKFPFLYVLSSSVNARSWIPLQDLPQARYTFKASIKVPEGLLALMSAKNPDHKSPNGEYQFEMNQSVPAYLLGLVVGDLERVQIGPRTFAYVEAPHVEKAKIDFQKLEEALLFLENILGPYRWEDHALVIMPRTFPIGGMEVPRLNFLHSNMLTGFGDSQSTVWHELAHGWCGNLVTCRTLDHFWVNEGMTVYLERRMVEKFYGADIAEMSAEIGYQKLLGEIEATKDIPQETALFRPLRNRHPSEKLKETPYEKGYLFFRTLESLVGREALDVFLRTYFDLLAEKSLDSEEFITFLENHLLKPLGVVDRFNSRNWIYQSGVPLGASIPKSKKVDGLKQMAKTFLDGNLQALDGYVFSYMEGIAFMEILSDQRLTEDHIEKMAEKFGLRRSDTRPGYISQWIRLISNNQLQKYYGELEEILKTRAISAYWFKKVFEGVAKGEASSSFLEGLYDRISPDIHALSRLRCEAVLKTLNEAR